MTTHLTNDEFVLAYYGEPALAARRAHLDACEACTTELAKLSRLLDRITPTDVPEPDAGYEQRIWQRLSWRLPSERRRVRSARVIRWSAVAAVVTLVFVTAALFVRREGPPETIVATRTAPPAGSEGSDAAQQTRDRILFVIVSDHFDQSERMLIELTNRDPENDADLSSERGRAEELLVSNRLYRQTARDRGEEQVARLLDELEPVLMQIAHTPSQVTAEEVRAIQHRVEAKGLVFKLRVVKTDVRANTAPPVPQPTI